MSSLDLQPDIAITAPVIKRVSRRKYPFDVLEVGVSFAVPAPKGDKNARSNINTAIFRQRLSNPGHAYLTRTRIEDENGEPAAEGVRVIRVWRTA